MPGVRRDLLLELATTDPFSVDSVFFVVKGAGAHLALAEVAAGRVRPAPAR